MCRHCSPASRIHGFGSAYDFSSYFEYVAAEALSDFTQDDIYSYGDFTWADFGQPGALGALSDDSIAELTFFGQMQRPLRSVAIPGLGNRFLWHSHDDGWYAKVYYDDWGAMERMLRPRLTELLDAETAQDILDLLNRDPVAYWLQHKNIQVVEKSEGMDELLRKYDQTVL